MSNKPYEYPHPQPWAGYGYFEAELRYRFQCFEKEAWFKQTIISYQQAQDDDWEWGANEIIKALEETAVQRGIKLRHRECNYCEESKESVSTDEPTCIECLAQNEIYKRRREAEDKLAKEVWEQMTPRGEGSGEGEECEVFEWPYHTGRTMRHRGECIKCGRSIVVTSLTGVLYQHHNYSHKRCEGSGTKPARLLPWSSMVRPP